MRTPKRHLGDSPDRSYALNLDRFTAFAEPELRLLFAKLNLPTSGAALDLGCGTGLPTAFLSERMGPDMILVGCDLSMPHLQAARRQHRLPLIQGDAERLCFKKETFDFIWSCNTVNHLADKVSGLRALKQRLRSGGRLVVAQSGFLPEMFFAWDAPLDEAVRVACHRYYRERYGLQITDTAAVRSIVRQMNAAAFDSVVAHTHIIERNQPLSQADRAYFQEAIFDGVWGKKILPYLDVDDQRKLAQNCDPSSADYCLNRDDFHHIQTLTVCEGINDVKGSAESA